MTSLECNPTYESAESRIDLCRHVVKMYKLGLTLFCLYC